MKWGLNEVMEMMENMEHEFEVKKSYEEIKMKWKITECEEWEMEE